MLHNTSQNSSDIFPLILLIVQTLSSGGDGVYAIIQCCTLSSSRLTSWLLNCDDTLKYFLASITTTCANLRPKWSLPIHAANTTIVVNSKPSELLSASVLMPLIYGGTQTIRAFISQCTYAFNLWWNTAHGAVLSD